MESARIGAIRTGEITQERSAVLLWVRTGVAEVRVLQNAYRLESGQALWINPGIPRTVETDPGTVLVPLFFPLDSRTAPVADVTVLHIPSQWDDWLMWQFANAFSYLRPATLGDIHAHREAHLPSAGRREAVQSVSLRLPRSHEAREVAYLLLRSPESRWHIDDYAREVALSSRSLRRRFITETGMSFSQWRQRSRINAAIDLLREGVSIGQAGRAIGLNTPAAFTQAFHRQMSVTPREYVKGVFATSGDRTGASASSIADVLLALLSPQTLGDPGVGEVAVVSRPPSVPPSRTWERINPFHVAVWLYRGSAVAHVGDSTYELRQGEALWIPAGIRNSIDLGPESLLLPLIAQQAHGVERRDAATSMVRFGQEHTDYLLHAVVAQHSKLRPTEYDPRVIVEAFRIVGDPVVPRSAEAMVQKVTAALQQDPTDARTIGEWAQSLGVRPADLRTAFARATGDSLPRWRSKLRMSRARTLLTDGETPSSVARTLGYAHLSGFSRVFKDAFGLSPRQYQQGLLR